MASWKQAAAQGDVPTARSSQALAAVKGFLYLFGGEQQPRQPLPAHTFRYDVSSDSWKQLETSGDAPSGRVGSAAAAIGATVFLFGGRTDSDQGASSLNDLHAFDTATSTWKQLQPDGEVPQKRSYHAAAACGDKIYVFGGCGAGGRLNELHCYDPDTNAWEQLPSSDAVPARGGPGFTACSDKLYVVGGFNGNELGDMHIFDTIAEAWQEVDLSGTPQRLPPRSVAAIEAVTNQNAKEQLVIFGGEVEPTDLGHEAAGSYSNDTFTFDPSAPKQGWRKLEGVAGTPSPRGWFASAALPGGILAVHGGNAPDNSRLADLHLLQL